ncbi:MAG: DUF1080 domain-containing protein [Phaeodactylibacter sp.]|uniref:3-keto-disaccharide hydrolase n=1 Tax=Phaeodactylibacter sp. TaxID=1940289 RepID=UPI0032EAB52E
MKNGMRLLCLLFFLSNSISSGLIAQSNDSWRDLFNGKDLSGWEKRNGEADYTVQEGVIVGVTQTKTPNTFLCTKETFSDFILEAEIWGDAAINSGIQFRSNSLPSYKNGRVHGYQAEVDPSQRAYSGGIYDEGRRGWLYPLSLNPEARTAYKLGQWNKYRIEAVGDELRIWVNGVNTANVVDDMTDSGFIGLQVHGIGNNKEKAGREIRWRNIRIKTKNLEEDRWPLAPHAMELNYTANTLTEYEVSKGWRLLWDGKTTEGWRSARAQDFPQKGWEIEEGVLTVLESDGGESTNGGDIITRDKFSSFELMLEFKITEGANSGIKYFVDPEINQGPGSSIGLEYQILDDKEHPDAKKGVKGNRTLASLYDLIPAGNLSVPGRNKPFRGIGQWNQARLVVKGNHIEHWLNGFKVIEYERNTPIFRALVAYSKYEQWAGFGELPQGHILLQDHGNRVSFRSIKIREF